MSDAAEEQKKAAQEEAQRYLQQVVSELLLREGRVAAIDEEISRLEYDLKTRAGGEHMARGDALLLVANESYRQALRRTLEKKRKARTELISEVDKARERKVMALEELEELNAGERNA